ncbi:MAG: nitroreductase family protein [Anaerovoracaceae bacterium]|jgi:nitroreductase
MDFFEVVNNRYSYRGEFLKEYIPKDSIRKILSAGIKAPTGYNLQSTSFIAVTDPGIIGEIAKAIPSPATETAPLIIVAISQNIVKEGLCFEVEDYSIACGYMLLAITALGYASVFMDGNIKMGAGEVLRKVLNVPEKYTVRAIMPIGVPKDPGIQAERMDFDERVTWDIFK